MGVGVGMYIRMGVRVCVSQSITKGFRSDLKKAAGSTIKAQRRVDKKGVERMSALEQAQEHLDSQAKGFEAFNQRILRTVLIEERRRYCYLVDNYISGEPLKRFHPYVHSCARPAGPIAASSSSRPRFASNCAHVPPPGSHSPHLTTNRYPPQFSVWDGL